MNWCNCEDNLVLDDADLAIREAMLFKHAGGGTLVDVTNVGLGRQPAQLRRISEETGLHVIMGASYYHALFHPPGTDEKTEEQICEEIVADLTEGVDGTDICAGIIGEVGCTWPLHPNEGQGAAGERPRPTAHGSRDHDSSWASCGFAGSNH